MRCERKNYIELRPLLQKSQVEMAYIMQFRSQHQFYQLKTRMQCMRENNRVPSTAGTESRVALCTNTPRFSHMAALQSSIYSQAI